jgi:hypothetical protein
MARVFTLIVALVCLLPNAACAKLSLLQQTLSGQMDKLRGEAQPEQPRLAEPQSARPQQTQSSSAPASRDRDPSDAREACRREVRQYCGGISPRSDATQRCITENHAKFSEQCRVMLQQRQGR